MLVCSAYLIDNAGNNSAWQACKNDESMKFTETVWKRECFTALLCFHIMGILHYALHQGFSLSSFSGYRKVKTHFLLPAITIIILWLHICMRLFGKWLQRDDDGRNGWCSVCSIVFEAWLFVTLWTIIDINVLTSKTVNENLISLLTKFYLL